ncbi:hypothetical protein BKK52_00780 [Rodentibacter trehalosifermentans]|uniref:Bro-N domain-containing protein n=1 Tax=Rodentibacter trehalosifermentans TaxID=1908263 RepID=A0A1V3J648_9PAST|nr:BRO family protein [Rodentibacter trehalosifermentans]OOF50715.1 hypothetical protein BKK52_00780 [Rodentibacter trehalosifermentans]
MSNQVQFSAFNFNSNSVRVITDSNQEPWFCATDVCDILGYQNAPLTVQKHCKQGGISKRYTPTQSGDQEMIFINEPNLYRLIIKSRKPEAEPFEAWVFEEVLPQIRKTGKYQLEPKQLALPEPPKMYQRELTEKEMQDFCWAWYALRNYIELTDKLQKQFGGFGGDYARAIRQLNERYANLPQEMLPTLQRITTEFNQDITHGNGWNRIIYNVRHPNAIIRSGGLVHLF